MAITKCVPIMSFFLALNISHIHYFSLDVEGAEPQILAQIPFHTLQIDVLTIEYSVYLRPVSENDARLKKIREIMSKTTLYHEIRSTNGLDAIFMRNPC